MGPSIFHSFRCSQYLISSHYSYLLKNPQPPNLTSRGRLTSRSKLLANPRAGVLIKVVLRCKIVWNGLIYGPQYFQLYCFVFLNITVLLLPFRSAGFLIVCHFPNTQGGAEVYINHLSEINKVASVNWRDRRCKQ